MNEPITVTSHLLPDLDEGESLKHKVCLLCMTYNQAGFITDAMDGFAMQKTSFPYVCCIVDDASTDGEQKVLSDYFRKHFSQSETYVSKTSYGRLLFARHKENFNCHFAVLLLKENHLMNGKDKFPYLSEWVDSAQYIALCDGDDFWTDSEKMQMQVSYLDRHPDCPLCCHNGYILSPEGKKRRMKYPIFSENISTAALFADWDYPTASFIVRKNLWNDDLFRFWAWAPVADAPLMMYAELHGNIHYIGKAMAVYRFQAAESWTEKVKNDSDFAKQVRNRLAEWTKKKVDRVSPEFRKYFLFAVKMEEARSNPDRKESIFRIRLRILRELDYDTKEKIAVLRCVLRSSIDDIKNKTHLSLIPQCIKLKKFQEPGK